MEIKEMMLEKSSREIGNAYRDMAEAYVALLNFGEVLPYCGEADIRDTTLRLHHVDSIEACQSVKSIHPNKKEKAVEDWRGHGPSAQDELKEAQRILYQLKVKVCCESDDNKALLSTQERRR
nr:protein kinesin light chain-related 1 [Tanacetum cinerariifolium]